MSITSIESVVMIFPDPLYLAPGYTFNPQKLPDQISYHRQVTNNLQTLSTNDADPDGIIQGLLYVPDIDENASCYNQSSTYLPKNVTRQANLPNMDFNIIALAPWLSINCTLEFLAGARRDPIRAFVFFLPDNDTAQPPGINSPVWSLEDGGQWKSANKFPVYAVPGNVGNDMIKQLSLYSGNLTNVPHGQELLGQYELDPRDYVRVYTEIDVTAQTSLPSLWVFLLIVAGGLIFILTSTSVLMHWLQRRRRVNLRRRIAQGQVDLESLGIKRLTVPSETIDKMPLYIYTCKADEAFRDSHEISHDQKSSNGVTDGKSNALDTGVPSATGAKSVVSTSPSNPASSVRGRSGSSLATHEYTQHAQPTCPICLEDFESSVTTIRELPCGHIYHPECIDSFLSNNSSLCPMCKKSTLPLGYCPETITNGMVRRERAIRRLRSHVPAQNQNSDRDVERGLRARFTNVRSASRRVFSGTTPSAHTPGVELESQRRPTSIRGELPTAGLTREEIAQQRVQEILEDTVVREDPDIAERRVAKWRKSLGKVFPGFK